MLTLPISKLAFIIEKAREFDAELPPEDGDAELSRVDDGEDAGILLDVPENPTADELRDAIESLNTDEQEELLALIWVGRGDFTPAEWSDAMQLARERHHASEADYLIGTPLLADYLEEAADQFGLGLDEDD